jgi:excisionase family DNA binding protein
VLDILRGMAHGDEIISVEQAAAVLGVTPRQVRNLIADGLLPAKKVGRDYIINRSDLDKVPKDRKPGPKPIKVEVCETRPEILQLQYNVIPHVEKNKATPPQARLSESDIEIVKRRFPKMLPRFIELWRTASQAVPASERSRSIIKFQAKVRSLKVKASREKWEVLIAMLEILRKK